MWKERRCVTTLLAQECLWAKEVRVSFDKKEAWIKFDDQKITVAKLREVINSTGFKAIEDRTGSE
jgi:copper chaperone CopZ